VHDKAAYQYGDWLIASPERKGRLKGTRSSSSTDTGGSDSKEPDKSLVQKKSNEPKSGDSNQYGPASVNAESRNDGKYPLQRDSDQSTNIRGDNRMALALVPNTEQMRGILDNSRITVGVLSTIDVHKKELERDEQPEGRGQKWLRKENDHGGADDIEMKAAGSLEEFRREQ